MSEKYPRTPHLPWSPGCTRDDKRLPNVGCFVGYHEVVTEKLDGSNTCLTRDNVFARSHAGPPSHPSFDALKALHANIRYLIPEDCEVFGEWCFAQHSIYYDRLPGYFLVFGVRLPGVDNEGAVWASWRDTEEVARNLGLHTVPVLSRSCFAESSYQFRYMCDQWEKQSSLCGETKEGFVVRLFRDFLDKDFHKFVAKWVRADHVTTDDHWSNGPIVQNKLRKAVI